MTNGGSRQASVVVLAAAQDAGGANALACVIEELERRERVQVAVAACAEAVRVFVQAGIRPRTIPSPEGPADGRFVEAVQRLLHGVEPDALLLGTAWGLSIDKVLLRLALDRHLPSISVVDLWPYLRERFADPVSGEVCLPTKIAVMDAVVSEQAVQAGLPKERLVVTGQPYLDALVAKRHDATLHHEAHGLRQHWLNGRPSGTRLVLFASEALARDFGGATPYYRGYTEAEVLEGVVEAVQAVEASRGWRMALVVKRHPREWQQPPRLGPLAARRDLTVVDEQSVWPCLLATDAVIGITSMILIEASLIGTPTISFQPATQAGALDPSWGTVMPVATSPQELTQSLTNALLSSSASSGHDGHARSRRLADGVLGDAASKIAEATLSLVSRQARLATTSCGPSREEE